jgi:hypothetical protein
MKRKFKPQGPLFNYNIDKILLTFPKGKAVPQHTYGEAHGGKGGTAPTHSQPLH